MLIVCSSLCCKNTSTTSGYLEPKDAPRDNYHYLIFLPTSSTFQRQYVEACISSALTWDQGCHPGMGCSKVLKICLIILQMFERWEWYLSLNFAL